MCQRMEMLSITIHNPFAKYNPQSGIGVDVSILQVSVLVFSTLLPHPTFFTSTDYYLFLYTVVKQLFFQIDNFFVFINFLTNFSMPVNVLTMHTNLAIVANVLMNVWQMFTNILRKMAIFPSFSVHWWKCEQFFDLINIRAVARCECAPGEIKKFAPSPGTMGKNQKKV